MSKSRQKVFVIIPAAGSGKRLGGNVKKQFLELKGKPILVHTIQQFENCFEVDEIALAVPESSICQVENMVSKYRLHKVNKIIVGGKLRQDSVCNAIKKLIFKDNDIILVHDGVRPFIDINLIKKLISVCKEEGAAVLAVQPKDTIRRSVSGIYFDQTLDRNALWMIQTPQAFKAKILLNAFKQAVKEKFYSTDEAALVERLGIKIKIVKGSYDNIKITTKEDLELGSMIFDRWQNE